MTMSAAEYNQRIQSWIDTKWTLTNPCPMRQRAKGWEPGAPAEMPIRARLRKGISQGRHMVKQR